MINPSEIRCHWLALGSIKKITDDFRIYNWPENTFPINIEKVITQRMGLDIIPEPNLHVEAYLRSDHSISVNLEKYMDAEYDNAIRFALAHELGHFVLHKQICDNFQFITFQEYLDLYAGFPQPEYELFELQANEFAGSLLVPAESLFGEVKKCACDLDDNKTSFRGNSTVFMQFLEIGTFFGVPAKVIQKRVERENYSQFFS